MGRTAGAIALAAVLATMLGCADSTEFKLAAHQRQTQASGVEGLRVGDTAPAVKLEYLKDGKTYDLENSFGNRPTVLIFGSYT